MVKVVSSKKDPSLRYGSNINQSSHVSNMIRTNLDSLPAKDADHCGQGQDEEGGEADSQDQDDTLVSLRSLKIGEHGVRFSCQRSA